MNRSIGILTALFTLIVLVIVGCGGAQPTAKQVSDKDGMTLLYVPAGEFTMGNNDGARDEQPIHTVYLDAYWIDQTEVTNAMFKRFVDATRYQTDAEKRGSGVALDLTKKLWSDTQGADWQHPRGPNSNLSGLDDHPVVQVSWNDATAYCQWAGGDLPTEAQWEKAARGTDGRIYPWGNQAPDKTRLNDNIEVGDTTQVGNYPTGVSPYGALDMAGNVWEWVPIGIARHITPVRRQAIPPGQLPATCVGIEAGLGSVERLTSVPRIASGTRPTSGQATTVFGVPANGHA